MNDIIERVPFPHDWDIMKMRQCFSFGKGLSITKEDLVEEGIPVISYGQVHSKENTGTGLNEKLYRYVPESFLKTSKSCIVRKNDFIFADTSEDYAGVGNCAFIDNNDTIFAGYHSIIARPTSSDLYPKYLAYLFLTDIWRDQIRANVMGIKVFSITQQLLRDTYIYVPPISEQKCIAKLLDKSCAKLDKIIMNLQRQIELLQKYKKSLITETVTEGLDKNVEMKNSGISWIGAIPNSWKIKRLKYLTKKIGSGKTPKGGSEIYDTEGVVFIRSQNVYDDGLHLDDVQYISDYIDADMQTTRLKKGDLLFNITGASIARCCLYDLDDRGNVNQHVCIIRLKKEYSNSYYRYVMSSEVGKVQTAINQMGGNRESLTFEQIGNFDVPLPPVDEQKRIAAFLDRESERINDLIAKKHKALRILNAHKTSLIYEYVTGKKRVKEDM